MEDGSTTWKRSKDITSIVGGAAKHLLSEYEETRDMSNPKSRHDFVLDKDDTPRSGEPPIRPGKQQRTGDAHSADTLITRLKEGQPPRITRPPARTETQGMARRGGIGQADKATRQGELTRTQWEDKKRTGRINSATAQIGMQTARDNPMTRTAGTEPTIQSADNAATAPRDQDPGGQAETHPPKRADNPSGKHSTNQLKQTLITWPSRPNVSTSLACKRLEPAGTGSMPGIPSPRASMVPPLHSSENNPVVISNSHNPF